MNFWNQKRVLVTGGTGFLGAYIIKALIAKGYAVRAIRRTNNLPAFIPAGILNKAEWVDGDVLDVVSLENAMDGVDGRQIAVAHRPNHVPPLVSGNSRGNARRWSVLGERQ